MNPEDQKSESLSSVVERITVSLDSMSKGQKAIANYILENYETAAYMTAAKLGETTGVSESTVVRFSMELGYEGYPHFQKALQEELKVKLTSVQRLNAGGQSGKEGFCLFLLELQLKVTDIGIAGVKD